MSSVQGSNVMDLEVVSSIGRTGAAKRKKNPKPWECRLDEKGRENLELVTVEDTSGRSDVSQNLVKEKDRLFLEGETNGKVSGTESDKLWT